ncbi:hypothetical protein [Salinisphaera sp. T31B1]|uniref:DUF58 domain-containing protein n=1 Tax=Salinisphaera sp. T31B1 TaxID=727963 RepID=UPI003340F4B2
MSQTPPDAAEFVYRVRWAARGIRPGAHTSRHAGMGQLFSGYASLLDYPDPRRLDVRASVRDPFGMLYTRVYRQRTAISLIVIADLSSSMRFGAKQRYIADCVACAARSAHACGDAFGFIGIGESSSGRPGRPRHQATYLAPSFRPGAAQTLARQLAEPLPPGRTVDDIEAMAVRLPTRRALVLLLSDFHWQPPRLERMLALLSRHDVVPVVLWDPREHASLPRTGLLSLFDPETGRRRMLFMRRALAERWRDAYAERRAHLVRCFHRSGRPPLFAGERFRPGAFTDYFLRSA